MYVCVRICVHACTRTHTNTHKLKSNLSFFYLHQHHVNMLLSMSKTLWFPKINHAFQGAMDDESQAHRCHQCSPLPLLWLHWVSNQTLSAHIFLLSGVTSVYYPSASWGLDQQRTRAKKNYSFPPASRSAYFSGFREHWATCFSLHKEKLTSVFRYPPSSQSSYWILLMI